MSAGFPYRPVYQPAHGRHLRLVAKVMAPVNFDTRLHLCSKPHPTHQIPIQSPYDAALEPQNIKEATERAINFYLNPSALKTSKPTRKTGKIYLIDPTVDDETLLVEAYESLSSASDMARDLADSVDSPHRKKMLILQQVIMLSELVVSRVLDNQRLPN
ncbi:hypothetical protein PS655_02414 [Pseudomonas fluorescens]|uniref:Uncharacterized protein n=1 Tax=Pseudomonas fluorescens TaxID=294 RepID=A0A5E6SPU2_PSEFL|nr:hypothetical protein PS655_02414 [Pseudomonas fluorescens]